MSTVTDLESKVKSLQDQLSQAIDCLHAARMDELGIHPGDIVISKGKEFKVSAIRFGFRKPWIAAHGKNRDGKWTLLTSHLYDNWEKP